MAIRGLTAWSSGSSLRRAVAVAGTAAVAAGAACTWWPNGDYQPIRPGERGTIGEALKSVRDAPGGRPSWTPARQQRFGAEPTVREQGAAERRARRHGNAGPTASPRPSPDRTRRTAPSDEADPGSPDDGGDAPAPGDGGSSSPASPTPSATPAPSSTAPAPASTAAPAATSTPSPAATASPSPAG